MTEYLYTGCVTLIMFIVLLVAGKKNKMLPDYLFLSWMLLLLINVSTFIVINHYNYPGSVAGRLLVEFSDASVFLHGPLFYFYTLALTHNRFKLHFKNALHLLPLITGITILFTGIGANNGTDTWIRTLITIVKMVSLLIYLVLVIKQLRLHRQRVKHIFSNTEDKYLDWLNFLAWGIMIVWVFSVGGMTVHYFTNFRIAQQGGLLGNIALCALIFLIGYFGVRQEAIFNFKEIERDASNPVPTVNPDTVRTLVTEDSLVSNIEKNADSPLMPDESDPDKKPGKYKNSGLTHHRSAELFSLLMTYMEEKKPYLDAELTLYSLSNQLKLYPNHVSQIINQQKQQNFFDFINEYRVRDVQDALISDKYQNHNLLGIAFEFGFNSKASFNRAFKKIAGVTPSEYKLKAVSDNREPSERTSE